MPSGSEYTHGGGKWLQSYMMREPEGETRPPLTKKPGWTKEVSPLWWGRIVVKIGDRLSRADATTHRRGQNEREILQRDHGPVQLPNEQTHKTAPTRYMVGWGGIAMPTNKSICDYAGQGVSGCEYHNGKPCAHKIPHHHKGICNEPTYCEELSGEKRCVMETENAYAGPGGPLQ